MDRLNKIVMVSSKDSEQLGIYLNGELFNQYTKVPTDIGQIMQDFQPFISIQKVLPEFKSVLPSNLSDL